MARLLTSVAILGATATAAMAQVSDDVVKIGILNDQWASMPISAAPIPIRRR